MPHNSKKIANEKELPELYRSPPITDYDVRLFQSIGSLNRALDRNKKKTAEIRTNNEQCCNIL
jgi:hypothetical protein